MQHRSLASGIWMFAVSRLWHKGIFVDGAAPNPGTGAMNQGAGPIPRRNFWHFDGSRIASWFPSFSVEVTHTAHGAQAMGTFAHESFRFSLFYNECLLSEGFAPLSFSLCKQVFIPRRLRHSVSTGLMHCRIRACLVKPPSTSLIKVVDDYTAVYYSLP